MAVKILVPEMGESVLEATVSRWLKKEGEPVSVGETLVEIETDKVNLEVGADHAGVLSRIDAPEGEDVKVGDLLGVIDESASPARVEPAELAESKDEKEPPPAEHPAEEEVEVGTPEPEDFPSVSPVAGRLARERGVDLSQVRGSGSGGRVTKDDVERFLQEQEQGPERVVRPPAAARPAEEAAPEPPRTRVRPPEPGMPAERPEERVRMSRRRRTIAQRLVEVQQTAAMLTTFNDVNMGPVMQLRKRHNEDFLARHGVKLGIVSFFIRASIGALKAFPRFNAEVQGDEMVLKRYYDIGVAIGAEDGLVVPVLRDADRLSFAAIEGQIKDLVEKAGSGSLSIEDLRGGTFTITNGGVFGSLLSTPILNPPQVGILGLHRIEDRPIVEDGEVVVRPMMYMALSYDHRIVDGREAVQFLAHIKRLIEDPERLLLEG